MTITLPEPPSSGGKDEGESNFNADSANPGYIGNMNEAKENWSENESSGLQPIPTREFILWNFLGYGIISTGAQYFNLLFGIIMGCFFIAMGIFNYIRARMFSVAGSTAIGIGMVVIILTVLYPEIMEIIGIIGYILFYVIYLISLFFD
ncbi:MAG: hypothetical protein ACTSUE_11385 [Promethearchaeota archaeon]